ncbi:MAG: type II toxin-antitoxin system PemK/MazF family toxin [Candidatus Limiplasma sp.]|nr:type II toxin-antitoxin system PemK/MazF family toxin [Candidatus Limiplasma sp.]MDY4061991.1 type II toxin-antitoxin system PemK/MazF family toxin [Candidatus Limiplasma sp.]
MKRGDIYMARLDPVVGSEQGGYRPVLIVQNDRGNRRAPTVIAVPLTASTRKPPLPTHVRLEAGEGGLRQPSIVLCEQLRTLEKTRLDRRLGRLSSKRMENVEEALRHSLDMHPCGISQEEREESNP